MASPSGLPFEQRGRTLFLICIAFACAMAALAAGTWSYRYFMSDDAFISLRYADRLLHGSGLTWADGERVEGYTNLLWVLGCALLGKLGLDLVWAARVLGLLGTAAAIASIVWFFRADAIRGALPGIAGGLALALAGPIVVWTFGGLEQPLLAGLLGWALALSLPLLGEAHPATTKILAPGLFLGLVVLTRADGAIFTIAAVLGIIAARGLNRESVRVSALLVLFPLVFFLGQLAFRRAYYGDWLPNSAFAKVGFTTSRLTAGLAYVAGLTYLAGLLVPALLALGVTDPRAKAMARFLGVMLVVWLGYVAVVGGDLFPGRRHLVPAVVMLAYSAALYLASRATAEKSVRPTLGLTALCLAALLVTQLTDPMNIRAQHERWEWDGEAVGGVLRTAFGDQRPLLAVDPAGCMPYYSRLPSVDMLGINDRYLAHHRPANFGTGYIGHELGNGAYVLSRKPDLVLFNVPAGGTKPNFRSGIEMMTDPRGTFRTTFRPVTLQCDRPKKVRSVIWMRREGGVVGIQRAPDRIRIPGYLLSENPGSRAILGPDNRLGVAVLPSASAEISGVPVPPGSWVARAAGSGGEVTLDVESTETGINLASGASGMRLPVLESHPTNLTIRLWTEEPGGAHVREILLERVAPDEEINQRPVAQSSADPPAPPSPRSR